MKEVSARNYPNEYDCFFILHPSALILALHPSAFILSKKDTAVA